MPGDIAAAHWAERINGGGEKVGWELARAFDAPLFVGERDPSIEPDGVEVHDLFEDTLSGRLIDRGGMLAMLGHQAGWGTAHGLRDYHTLISSGNECLAYVQREDQPWVHYVHHTSRYATDRLNEVSNKHPSWIGPVKRRVEYLQRWTERQIYGRYAHKPTLLVANSDVVAKRIENYWGRHPNDIRVVYPPIPTQEYPVDAAPTGDYYVTLSRLDWHKNIHEIIQAFNQLGDEYQLIVAGDGQERQALEAQARENITFEGYVSEDRKRELLAGARGFVFAAQAEDFGIAPVEAMAAGTPVIGVKEGFTQHQIQNGKNGITWARAGGHLREAIRRFERHGIDWTPREIAEFARLNFGVERFHEEIQAVVEEARKRQHVTVELTQPLPETTLEAERAATDGGGDPQ